MEETSLEIFEIIESPEGARCIERKETHGSYLVLPKLLVYTLFIV